MTQQNKTHQYPRRWRNPMADILGLGDFYEQVSAVDPVETVNNDRGVRREVTVVIPIEGSFEDWLTRQGLETFDHLPEVGAPESQACEAQCSGTCTDSVEHDELGYAKAEIEALKAEVRALKEQARAQAKDFGVKLDARQNEALLWEERAREAWDNVANRGSSENTELGQILSLVDPEHTAFEWWWEGKPWVRDGQILSLVRKTLEQKDKALAHAEDEIRKLTKAPAPVMAFHGYEYGKMDHRIR